MRLAIIGSRRYKSLHLVWRLVNLLPADTTVISGGAWGVDKAAEDAARKRGLSVMVFAPEWEKYGKRAALIRNTQIVEAADAVVYFWDGFSRGTMDTVRKSAAAGKPCVRHYDVSLIGGLGDIPRFVSDW